MTFRLLGGSLADQLLTCRRHEAVMRRVKEAVNGSEAKVTSFKLTGESEMARFFTVAR